MTDRLKGFTVALTTDIREDDAEAIRQAILMIKGVLDVTGVVSDSNDWLNRQQIKSELREKLWEVVK